MKIWFKRAGHLPGLIAMHGNGAERSTRPWTHLVAAAISQIQRMKLIDAIGLKRGGSDRIGRRAPLLHLVALN